MKRITVTVVEPRYPPSRRPGSDIFQLTRRAEDDPLTCPNRDERLD